MSRSSDKAHEIYAQCVQNESYQEGIEALDALIAEGAETPGILQLRSHLNDLAGHIMQAVNDLDKAVRLQPGSRGLYYDRGILYHKAGEFALALKDFCKAVCLASECADDDLIDAAEHHIIALLEKMRST